MSHLKEAVTLTFTTDTPGTDYELIFPSVTKFTFNTNFAGSYSWISSTGVNPSSQVDYIVTNEVTTNVIGHIYVSTGGAISFSATTNLTVEVGDVVSIKAANVYGLTKPLGVSLVGER